MLAFAADGDRARREDLAGHADGVIEHLANHRRAVHRRLGVGHRDDGRVAAKRGGAGARLDGLGFLAAGLAQMGVQVDEPGRDDAAARVDHVLRFEVLPDLRRSRCHDTSTSATRVPGLIDNRAALDDGFGGLRHRDLHFRVGGTARPCAPIRRWRLAR